VWRFIADLLKDPERIRAGMERLIDEERNAGRGDPERESKAWAEKLAECDRLRKAYQQQQAAGFMTLEELGSMLRDLEETRRVAQAELGSIEGARSARRRWRTTGTTCWSSWRVRCPQRWTASRGRRETNSTGCCA
jgi:hypothetical protein